MIENQNVLITGGAGSVGRSLVPPLLAKDPNVIRLFDNNEGGLVQADHEFNDERLRYLLGNIRERPRLARAMEDIDVVIHTAGIKHVDISEYNPFEAVKTNVLGLQNVVETATEAGVDRVVFTSSDKAVTPANTMGTSKLLGEKLTTAGNKYRGSSDLRLTSVRFGNVINSSRSVVPVFEEQIRNGGPVTLTDERMTRFFLTYSDVADLITTAIEKTGGGEVFVRKMPAVRIEDLAETMIDTLAGKYGHRPEDIDIELIGRRVGETLHEEIMTEREVERTVENDEYYAIQPETTEKNRFLEYDGLPDFSPAEGIVRSSERAEKIDREEIEQMILDSVGD